MCRYDVIRFQSFTQRGRMSKHINYTLTHLHTESPAAFDKLGNVPLTLAVAPRLLEKLHTESKYISIRYRQEINTRSAKRCVRGLAARKQSYSRRSCGTCHLLLTSIKLANKENFRLGLSK